MATNLLAATSMNSNDKHAVDEADPCDGLKRWRQAAVVLNASRRFRYTLDLKKEEDKEQRRRTVLSYARVITEETLRLQFPRKLQIGPNTKLEGGHDLHHPQGSDPFEIPNTKNSSGEDLKPWRQAALVLNVSRKLQYTSDLEKEEMKDQRERTIRAHGKLMRVDFLTSYDQAADLFKLQSKQRISWHDLHCPQDSDPFDIAAMKKCPRATVKRWRLTASKVAAFIICLILCLHGAYANALQSKPPVKEVDQVQPAQVLPRKLVLQTNATGPIQLQKQPPLIDSTTLTRLIIIVAPSLGVMIVVAIFCRRKQNGEPAADAVYPVRPNVTYNFSIIGSLFSAA